MIFIRGPQIMKGYYNKPEETSAVFFRGYFNSGDIGYTDSEGRLYFVGRIKVVIKRRGENIYASQVEKALAACPLVAEAVVVGIPDIKDGEVPVACIVPKLLGTEQELTESVLSFIKQNAIPLQIPAKVLVFDSLDEFKNIIGKVLKRKLTEEVLKRLQ